MPESIVIYWAPRTDQGSLDWSILYDQPVSMISTLNEIRDYSNQSNTFFKCPSWRDLASKTFVIHCPISTGAQFDIGKDEINSPVEHYGIPWKAIHSPSLKGSPILQCEMGFYFFSEEEDLEMTLTAPYFNRTDHLQYGAVIPGQFKIDQWFRPINMEFNLWKDCKEIHLKEGEPIAYVNFNSDKTIIFKRFILTKELYAIASTLSHGGSWEPKVPLAKRYARFRKSKMKNIIMKHIKESVIE